MFDLKILGLGQEEQEQLSAAEKNIIGQTAQNNKPLLNYTAHCIVNQLETDITGITNIIAQHGTLLALIPTHAKDPAHDYTFMVIFTSTKSIQELSNSLTLPGTITRWDGTDGVQTCAVKEHKPSPQTNPIQKTDPSGRIRMLRFTANDHHFALPFKSIAHVLHCDHEHLQPLNNHYLYSWKTKPIKAFFLVDLVPSSTATTTSRIEDGRHNILVLTHQHETIALIVDTILGQKEIKDFGDYAGHADFGDDKLVIIINIEKLFELAQS